MRSIRLHPKFLLRCTESDPNDVSTSCANSFNIVQVGSTAGLPDGRRIAPADLQARKRSQQLPGQLLDYRLGAPIKIVPKSGVFEQSAKFEHEVRTIDTDRKSTRLNSS